MKIFLMITSSGSYEDYYEEIKGAYLSKENCQEAIDQYNDELHLKQTMHRVINEYCEEVFSEMYDTLREADEYIYENKEYIAAVRDRIKDLPKPYNDLKDEEIIDIALYWYDIFEQDDARMKTIEVLDVQQ